MDSATSKIISDNDKVEPGNEIARVFNKLCDDQVDSKKGVVEVRSLLPSPESLCTEEELDLVESRHKTKGKSEMPKCLEGVASSTVGTANLDSKTCAELKTTLSRKNREGIGNSCDLSLETLNMDKITRGQDITVDIRVPSELNQRGRREDESHGQYEKTRDEEEFEESVNRFPPEPRFLGNCQQNGNMEELGSIDRDTPDGFISPHRYNCQATGEMEELGSIDRDTPDGFISPHRYNCQATGEMEELGSIDRDTPDGYISPHRYNCQATGEMEELGGIDRDAAECRMTLINRSTQQNRLRPNGSEVNYQNQTSAKGQNGTFFSKNPARKKQQSQKTNSNNPTSRYEADSPGSKNCVASVEFSKSRSFDNMDSYYDEKPEHISRPLELNHRYVSNDSGRRLRSMRVGSYIESEESSCQERLRKVKPALFRQGTGSKIPFGDSSESSHERSIYSRRLEFLSTSGSSPFKSKSCNSEADCQKSSEFTTDLLSFENYSKRSNIDAGSDDSSMYTGTNGSFSHISRNLHALNDLNYLKTKPETNDSFRIWYDEIQSEYSPINRKRKCQTDIPLEGSPSREFRRGERSRSLREDESTICCGYEPRAIVKSDSVQEQTDSMNPGSQSKRETDRHDDVEPKDHPSLSSCDQNFEDNKNMRYLISAVSAQSDDISLHTRCESNNRQKERSLDHKTNMTLPKASVCASFGAGTYKKSDRIHSDWSYAQKLRSEGRKDCNGMVERDSNHIHRAIGTNKPREARKPQILPARQEKISEASPEMAPECPNTDPHQSKPDGVVKTRGYLDVHESIDLKRASNPKFSEIQVDTKRVYDKPEMKTQGEANPESCVFIRNNDVLIKTCHPGTATEKQEATFQESLKTVGSSCDQTLSSIYHEREKLDSRNIGHDYGSKGKDFPSVSRKMHPETSMDVCFDSKQTNSHNIKVCSEAESTFSPLSFDQTKSLHIHATTGADAPESSQAIPVVDSVHDQKITTLIDTISGRNTNSGIDERRDHKDFTRKTALTDGNTNPRTISPRLRSPLPSQCPSKDTSPASIQGRNIIKARKSGHTSKRRNCFTLASPESLCTDDEPDVRPKSSKRGRTVIAGRQLDALMSIFQKTPFPNAMMREEIGYSLGIKPRTVQIWFQNQRQKTKTVLKDGGMYCGQLSMYRSSKNGEFALLDLLSDAAELVYRDRDVLERLSQMKKQTE